MPKNEFDQDHITRPLNYEEIGEITKFVVDTVAGWSDETPYRDSQATKEGRDEPPFPPDLRQNRLFPKTGYAQAYEFAKQFVAAVSAKATHENPDAKPREARKELCKRLRFLMVRFKNEPVEPKVLRQEFELFSRKLSAATDDVRRIKSANEGRKTYPLLTGIHIRRSSTDPSLLDLHAHLVWDISGNNLKPVLAYLNRRFETAWCDEEPVQNPENVAFYIGRGRIDYADLREWDEEQLRAVWELDDVNFLRTSGWVRSPPPVSETLTTDEGPTSQVPPRGEEMNSEQDKASSEANDTRSDKKRHSNEKNANSIYDEIPYLMIEPVRSPWRDDFIKPPIRDISSEKINLRAYPSEGETMAVAILVVATYRIPKVFDYSTFCSKCRFDEKQLSDAVKRVEKHYNVPLFVPGSFVDPTSEGVAWADRILVGYDVIRNLVRSGRAGTKRLPGQKFESPIWDLL